MSPHLFPESRTTYQAFLSSLSDTCVRQADVIRLVRSKTDINFCNLISLLNSLAFGFYLDNPRQPFLDKDKANKKEKIMSSNGTYFVYAATYDNLEDAKHDRNTFIELALVGVVGRYDTAILTKDRKGKVHIKKHGSPAKSGAWRGALAGSVISLLFPPSILVGGLVGGAAGAASGKLWGGLSRSDLKELGELMDDGESGLVIFGESKLDEFVEKALKRAKKKISKAIKQENKELEQYLKELEAHAEEYLKELETEEG